MEVILLILALIRTPLHVTTLSLPPEWNCTSPALRAMINTAFQERLLQVGMGQMPQVATALDGLRDATSPRAFAVAHQFEQYVKLPEHKSRICEIEMPNGQEPMFITVLFINPATGEPGGTVFNVGFGPGVITFGSVSD